MTDEQICYTSEERYAECIGNVRKYIKAKLDSGLILGESFQEVDISQCDNPNYCTCENCRRVFEEEGGNSGAVVRFANRLSEELNKEYPGLAYLILAYMGTNTAPKVTRPNEFVYTTFCYDHNCTNHKADGSECNPKFFNEDTVRTNDVFSEWLEGWCNVTDNLYLYFYFLDTGLLAYSTLGNIYADFTYFYDMGVASVVCEAVHYGLGIQTVSCQVLYELNMNINMTEEEYEKLLCHTLEKNFGDGWNDIRSYISIWEEAQNQAPCWHCWSWQWTFCDVPRFSTKYYGEHLEKSIELVENAVRLASSKKQEKRAELFTCHVYYSGCYSLYYAAEDSGDRATIKRLTGYYDKVMEILYKYGFDPVEKGLPTIDNVPEFSLKYSQRLAGAAVYDWIYCKDYLTYHEYWDENPFYSY